MEPMKKDSELGFRQPIPMTQPSPGVVDAVILYQRVARQIHRVDQVLSKPSALSSTSASAAVALGSLAEKLTGK